MPSNVEVEAYQQKHGVRIVGFTGAPIEPPVWGHTVAVLFYDHVDAVAKARAQAIRDCMAAIETMPYPPGSLTKIEVFATLHALLGGAE